MNKAFSMLAGLVLIFAVALVVYLHSGKIARIELPVFGEVQLRRAQSQDTVASTSTPISADQGTGYQDLTPVQ